MRYKFPQLVPLISICLLLFTNITEAQSWQWGQRGGSAGNSSPSDEEIVKDIAIDKDGNIYVLANAGDKFAIDVAGQTINGYDYKDVILASFSCDGSLRWVKRFGSWRDDGPLGLGVDGADGVYMAVVINKNDIGDPVFIDNDQTISNPDYKNFYIVKYNTSGNLQWVRAPQYDTVPKGSGSVAFDMEVDSKGNQYYLCQLTPGLYGGPGGFVATTIPFGDYILKYDKDGNFLGGFKMETGGCWGAKMTIDFKTGNIYLTSTTGGNPLTIGSSISVTPLTAYVAAFDNTGKLKWLKQSNPSASPPFSTYFCTKSVIDAAGNIYIGGEARKGDIFNGLTINSVTPYTRPIIMKIDSNGNKIWATYAEVNAATFGRGGIALRNTGEVILAGSLPGKLKWGDNNSDTLDIPPNNGYMPFITRFNAHTGKVLGIEHLPTNKSDAYSQLIRADNRNNVYIGGGIAGTLYVGPDTLYSTGGYNDWSVVKYGQSNCGCTNIPEPKFSFMRSGQTVNFKYTGSSYTTIEWDFDDGTTSTLQDPAHTYGDSILYIPCVKVTNACGDNTYCSILSLWPDNVSTIGNENKIHFYPNPVASSLTIDGIEKGTVIAIVDMTGRKLIETIAKENREVINTQQLWVGTYMLQLTDSKGNRITKTIVRQ